MYRDILVSVNLLNWFAEFLAVKPICHYLPNIHLFCVLFKPNPRLLSKNIDLVAYWGWGTMLKLGEELHLIRQFVCCSWEKWPVPAITLWSKISSSEKPTAPLALIISLPQCCINTEAYRQKINFTMYCIELLGMLRFEYKNTIDKINIETDRHDNVFLYKDMEKRWLLLGSALLCGRIYL